MTQNFDCDRTCPLHGEAMCRFRPILDLIGPVKANSHTVTIKVELKNKEALKSSVEQMNGKFLDEGTHNMYGGQRYTGLGFTLPRWAYPLVLENTGELRFDTYRGQPGCQGDIDLLKSEYSIQLATHAASAQGWQHERCDDGLRVHHPNGGAMLVRRNGTAEAFGFSGVGCHAALTQLGVAGDFTAKPELNEVQAKVEQSCQ